MIKVLFLSLFSFSLFAQGNSVKDPAKEESAEKKEEDKTKLPKDFVELAKEMPPFHLMTEFQNGHVELLPLSIPIIRNEKVVCTVEMDVSLQTKGFKDSLELWRHRRKFQDKVYNHLYWLFDFAWEENWHPKIDPIRLNIKKALEPLNTEKLMQDVFIIKFFVKNEIS